MSNVNYRGGKKIKTWEQFGKQIRVNGCHLLKELNRFPESVLVTGCQRSGTTILSRIIASSHGMHDFRFGRDDELDAALILSGYVDHEKQSGRYCFQTTYLNECYHEYFEQKQPFKVIWVLRNPYSVVYSLIHNWKRYAFNELFEACGATLLNPIQKEKYTRYGKLSISRPYRACLSFNGKISQLFEIVDTLGSDRIMIVEYDELVKNKEIVLNAVYDFIGHPYKEEYGEKIHTSSITKSDKLSKRERQLIEKHCLPVYQQAANLLTKI